MQEQKERKSAWMPWNSFNYVEVAHSTMVSEEYIMHHKNGAVTFTGKVVLFKKTWNPFLAHVNSTRWQITLN